MKNQSVTIRSQQPPVVELDSEAQSAYIRFTNHKVAKTEPLITAGCIVTVDFDAPGEVVGIELVGVTEFGVEALLKMAGVAPLPKRLAGRARYVPAKLQMA